MAGQQRGPRGENVSVVVYKDDGFTMVEVFAAAGVRPTKHASMRDRVEELEADPNRYTILANLTLPVV